MVSREDGKPINLSEAVRIRDVPYFQDGAILKVDTRNPKKESHIGIKASDIE